MAVAFPRGIFHDLGLRFDESLPTVEDWDFLVRTAGLVGRLRPRSSPVCIDGGALMSRRQLHHKDEWERAEERVLASSTTLSSSCRPARLPACGSSPRRGGDKAAELTRSHYETVRQLSEVQAAQLDEVQAAHDHAVELWHAAQEREAHARERAQKWRARLAMRKFRFEEHVRLMREANEALHGPSQDVSVFELDAAQLQEIVDAAVGQASPGDFSSCVSLQTL